MSFRGTTTPYILNEAISGKFNYQHCTSFESDKHVNSSIQRFSFEIYFTLCVFYVCFACMHIWAIYGS